MLKRNLGRKFVLVGWSGVGIEIVGRRSHTKATSNDYIAGNGSILKVNMFIMWFNIFAKLVNVKPFSAVFF